MMRTLLIVFAMAWATSAAADDSSKADAALAARAKAKALSKTATNQDHDDAAYVACGQAYLDAYNLDPDDHQDDEILYNAGVCFEEGKSLGAALQAHLLLQKYYPRSKIVGRSLLRIASIYERIAYFDRAAASYEEYARKYAGEKDASAALASAIKLRTALSDSAAQIQDTRDFVKQFGAKQPQQAAEVTYALLPLYDQVPDDAIKLIHDYLAQFGKAIDAEHAIAARVRLGDLLWAKSCPVHAIDGLCVKIVADKPSAAKTRCGPASIPRVVVVSRAASKKEAMAAYVDAIAVFEHANGAAGNHAAAQAKLALADDDLERLLETSFPTGLDFDPVNNAHKDASLKRFNAWLEAFTAAAKKLDARYEAVLAIKDPESSIAATERLGQVVSAMSRQLLIGEIPKNVRAGEFSKEKLDAYCDAMTAVAEPLEARASEIFQTCLTKSTELGLFTDGSRVCQHELQLLRPDVFPPLSEVHSGAVPPPGHAGVERPADHPAQP